MVRTSAIPEAIEAWLSYFREAVVPVLRHQPGNLGYLVLGSATSNECLIIGYWEDGSSLELAVFDDADLRLAVRPVDVHRESIEVAFLVQTRRPTTGNSAQLLTFLLRPEQVYAAVAFFEANLLPGLESDPQFVGCTVMAESSTGKVHVLLIWTAVGPSQHEAGATLGREFAEGAGGVGQSLGRYEVVEALSLSEKV